MTCTIFSNGGQDIGGGRGGNNQSRPMTGQPTDSTATATAEKQSGATAI